jgi:hypothetical protein
LEPLEATWRVGSIVRKWLRGGSRHCWPEPACRAAITSAGSGDRVVFTGNFTVAADLPAVQIISSAAHGAGEPCATPVGSVAGPTTTALNVVLRMS